MSRQNRNRTPEAEERECRREGHWLLMKALLIASLWIAAPVAAQERFRLFTECSPVGLDVVVQVDSNGRINLTKDAVTRAVRSRLRAARIYSDTIDRVWLLVRVQVVSQAFGIDFAFRRVMFIESEYGSATTWNAGGLGTHGNDSGAIINGVSRYTDTFIDEYLRVNAETC